MELLINCNATVDLIGLENIVNVTAEINDYNLKNDLLEGKVLIKGCYKNNQGEEIDFEKEIPITVVFKEENVNLVNLNIEKFKYYEIVNQGIECEFITKVLYTEINEELLIEKEEISDEVINKKENDDLITEESNDSFNDDKAEIYEEIEEGCDEILNNVLNDRIYEVKEEDEKVKVNEIIKEDNKVSFRNIKDNYGSYKVYFINDERSLETISKIENKSFEEIYKNNQNFESKKRIILK